MRGMEEIYHEGEEGARRAGIGSAYTFLRVPGEPQLALVVNISVPGLSLIKSIIPKSL
jgi:hypothetical protein